MAVTGLATTVNSGAGNTGTAAVTTPAFTFPTGTVAGDRVFIATSSVGAPTAPANWTQVLNQQVGGGTMGASTGLRYLMVCYRDYDGVWTMPTVTAASAAANTIVGCAATFQKAAGESWLPITSTSVANDTDTANPLNLTGASSITLPTSASLWLVIANPAAMGTLSTITQTVGGTALTGVNNFPAAQTNTTGNDASIIGRQWPNQAAARSGTPVLQYATMATPRSAGGLFLVIDAGVVAASASLVPSHPTQRLQPLIVR